MIGQMQRFSVAFVVNFLAFGLLSSTAGAQTGSIEGINLGADSLEAKVAVDAVDR